MLIKKSCTNSKWQEKNRLCDAQQIITKYGFNYILACVLANRVANIEDIEDFINPKLKIFLPNPLSFVNMQKAIDRVFECIKNNQNICVLADYDVDGATSSALLIKFFQYISYPLELYIPDRLKEGYGPSIQAIEYLSDRNIDVLITVDCGTTAFAPLKLAKDKNIDVIVLDHHKADSHLPECYTIVNPQLDDSNNYKYLAAAGVVFMFVIALNRLLIINNYYKRQEQQPPQLIQWLDIVAIGTVCDMVPLINLNRAIVSQGLKIINNRKNIGIEAIANVIGTVSSYQSSDIGYKIGPMINSGGRLGNSYLGSKLLSSCDQHEAINIANQLYSLNEKRKQVEKLAFIEALDLIDDDKNIIFVYSDSWNIGIIGILAGRLKEIYNFPSLVMSINNGIAKGSGRSIDGIDLGQIIIDAVNHNILDSGGGHKMAVGFSLLEENLDKFYTFVSNKIAKTKIKQKTILYDAVVDINTINKKMIESINIAEPFGIENPKPIFFIPKITLTNINILSESHIKAYIVENRKVQAIAFKVIGSDLGDALLECEDKVINLLGSIELNYWNNNSYCQIIIHDISYS